jgi:hypothetical protein
MASRIRSCLSVARLAPGWHAVVWDADAAGKAEQLLVGRDASLTQGLVGHSFLRTVFVPTGKHSDRDAARLVHPAIAADVKDDARLEEA